MVEGTVDTACPHTVSQRCTNQLTFMLLLCNKNVQERTHTGDNGGAAGTTYGGDRRRCTHTPVLILASSSACGAGKSVKGFDDASLFANHMRLSSISTNSSTCFR